MDRMALEFASEADRPFQIAELPAQPVLSDLPAPFLARCSRREALHLALHHHVLLNLPSASYWRPYWPFCNRSRCQTVIFKMKVISIWPTPKKNKKKICKLGPALGRVQSIYVHTSSTPPAQHCCCSGMHCGNRHTGSQSSPVIKYQSRLSLIIHLTKQTRVSGVLWSMHRSFDME